MPIIAPNESRLIEIINGMTKENFAQYLSELDPDSFDGVKSVIRKGYMLQRKLPDYLGLVTPREEKILDAIKQNDRLSINSLYNSLDKSSSETLFILGFRADVQYFVIKGEPGSMPNFFSPNDTSQYP